MKWKQSLALFLAVSCVMLTGCRESEVIQNVLLTTDAAEVDDTEILDSEQQEQIDEMAQFLSEKQQEETKRNPVNVESVAKAAEDPSDIESGDNSGYQTGKTGENRNPGEGGDSVDSGDSDKGSVLGQDAKDKTDEEDKQQEQTPDPNDDEDTGNNSAGRLEDDPNARQIYDADGNIVTLPELVSSVAAPSEIGLITQMLGGNGMLVASSADLLTNHLAQEVFADEGISQTIQLWSEDGSNGMTDSNFQKLLEMHPDCCIVFNGDSNLSENQKAKLKEADIPVVLIPKLSSAKNIETAVRIVGETLGDNSSGGGLNSKQLALDYVNYEQALVTKVSKVNGICSWRGTDFYDSDSDTDIYTTTSGTYNTLGKSTLYIDEWDDDAYLISGSAVNQYGIAVVTKDYKYHAMSWYLSAGGVIDSISQFIINVSACRLYLNPTTLYESSASTNISGKIKYHGEENNWSGWEGSLFGISYSGSYANTFILPSDFVGFLGDESFPAVLVSSEEIKTKLEASRDSSTGLYRPAEWSAKIVGNNGYMKWYLGLNDGYNHADKLDNSGFIDVGEDNGEIPTSIHGYYDVYVNPCGVGSWTDGSVEAFLESYWASSIFYGSYSQSQVNAQIEDFYKTFYRHDLTDTQLDDILDGL